MALFQKPHTPACTIKKVMGAGFPPTLRLLDLGTDLWKHLSKEGIKSVEDLALRTVDNIRAILAPREDPNEDLVHIQTALKNVGLKLGMTPEELTNYKNKKAS